MPSKLNHTAAALRVCVDKIESGRISGTVFSQRLTSPLVFSDIGSLLLQMEEVLDIQKFPQAFQRTRSFQPSAQNSTEVPASTCLLDGMSPELVNSATGQICSFLIFVITRRNTTWQGELDWLDGTPVQPFTSVLQLIKLTDQHLFNESK